MVQSPKKLSLLCHTSKFRQENRQTPKESQNYNAFLSMYILRQIYTQPLSKIPFKNE